jgi:hypothetical protein
VSFERGSKQKPADLRGSVPLKRAIALQANIFAIDGSLFLVFAPRQAALRAHGQNALKQRKETLMRDGGGDVRRQDPPFFACIRLDP